MLFQAAPTAPAAAAPDPLAQVAPVETLSGVASTLQQFADEAVKTVARFAPSVIGAMIFFIIAWIASGILSRWLSRVLARARVEITIAKFLATLLRWSLIALSAVACLGMFGVNIAAFAAVLGAVGLAIGLALQGSLSNLAAGVMLLLFRPFKVGDAISVAGQAGIVDEIELFSTRLDTPDNRRIIIPNATAFNAIVENTSHHENRRVDIMIGVSFASDIPTTRLALTAALDSIPEVLDDPASVVVIVRFGKSAIEWQVGAWCKRTDVATVQQAAMQAVQDQLTRAGIQMVPML
ncbi:MAG: mechanosensitive ion channel [Planctomycetota bacterium]|nr:mechanosensitive ion channel [Planctomycetota bacterium]